MASCEVWRRLRGRRFQDLARDLVFGIELAAFQPHDELPRLDGGIGRHLDGIDHAREGRAHEGRRLGRDFGRRDRARTHGHQTRADEKGDGCGDGDALDLAAAPSFTGASRARAKFPGLAMAARRARSGAAVHCPARPSRRPSIRTATVLPRTRTAATTGDAAPAESWPPLHRPSPPRGRASEPHRVCRTRQRRDRAGRAAGHRAHRLSSRAAPDSATTRSVRASHSTAWS